MGWVILRLLVKRSIALVFAAHLVLFLGCGDSKKETPESAETGSISLKVQWPKTASGSKRALSGNPCSDFNIDYVVATVYDMSNGEVKKGDNWDCGDRQGTIEGITHGQRYVVIEAFVADVDSTPEWRGTSIPIPVEEGQNNSYLLTNPISMGHTSDNTGPNPNDFEINPVNGATNIPVNASIEVLFDEQVAAVTVFKDSFYITPTGSTAPIDGTVTYNPVSRIALFDPTDDLSPGTTYVVTVVGGQDDGIRDLAGNKMTNSFTWTFTTASALDSDPPQVSSSSPSSGNNFVELGRVIEVCFTETMRLDSINNQTILVQSNGSPVSGTVTYPASGSSCSDAVIFNPASLVNGTPYTVTILSGSSGVKDLAGNGLAADYTWSFETIASNSTDLIWNQGNWNEKNWN